MLSPFSVRPISLQSSVSDEELERELSDEELRAAEEGLYWNPEEVYGENFSFFDDGLQETLDIPAILPSQFTEFAFKMPTPGGEYESFTFDGRKHLRRIYDTPAKRILLCCGRQVEKSEWIHALTLMSDGSWKPAGEIRVGDLVATLDVPRGGALMTMGRVNWVSRRYFKPCIRIRSRQGHSAEVARTHPMRIWDGWKEAGAVRCGDRLAVVRRSGEFGEAAIPLERVRLTAYLLGDGYIEKSPSFCSLPGVKLDEFLSDLKSVGATYRIERSKKTKAVSVRIHKSVLSSWMEEDNLVGARSATKFVPSWVFALSKQDTALFLNRLWSTDGHVKRNNGSKYSIEYCSISKRLILEVQSLLWKFGIPSKIRVNWPALYKKRNIFKPAYILRVETQVGIKTFLEEVGALGKSENIRSPAVDPNNNRDTYPIEINDLIKDIIASNVSARKSLRVAGLRATLKYPLTAQKLTDYLEYFEADAGFDSLLVAKLRAHLNPDIFWDSVESVQPLGELECVDFQVERTHNFVVGGFVTHNSTLLGNLAITYSCMVPAHRTLYVSPSATQTKVFSVDRIKEPLETSPILRAYTTSSLQQNVFEKQFANRSKITLRYAFLNADRCRGIPAWRLLIDEIQDILGDNIPVIEQCTSHAPEEWRGFVYSGTPKGLDNVLEYYRSGTAKNGLPMSTMGEWMVPCDAHGGEGGRFWNVLSEKNIQKKGLSCEKCHKLINPYHPDAQWAKQNKEGIYESYRIPQLMVPWRSWDDIMLDYGRYPRDRFYNEVLGISYDSGLRPLTRQQVRDCCKPDIRMHPDDLETYKPLSVGRPVFAGIDWGCYSEDTRTLTDKGWKYYWEIGDEDLIAQYDPLTANISYVRPLKKIVFDYEGDMIHFSSNNQDLLVTPDHKMLYRLGSTGKGPWHQGEAQDLVGKDNVRFRATGIWQGKEELLFLVPRVQRSDNHEWVGGQIVPMDLWLQFLGLLVSEGGTCLDNRDKPCMVVITQREVHPEKVAFVRSVVEALPFSRGYYYNPETGDHQWKLYGKELWSWCADNIGLTPSTKCIPREFLRLSVRQLRILFEALMLGDGTWDIRCEDNGAYYTTSPQLADDVLELAWKVGLRGLRGLHQPEEGNRAARYRVGISPSCEPSLHTRTGGISRIPYKGKAYCFSVPSGYFVTERNGKVSQQGNTGENSYTVMSLGIYYEDKFRIFYIHRFTGEDVDPTPQMMKINEMLSYFNVRVIATDYGGGFDRNDTLARKFGPKRVNKYQYMARGKKKVFWNPNYRRWQITRTEVMSDVFNAIKRKQIDLPRWEEFEDPYGNDLLNIYAEYNETLRMIQYSHRPDRPDDAFHSILYCFLGSMIVIPRPDIVAPNKEFPGVGPLRSNYRGPIDQS